MDEPRRPRTSSAETWAQIAAIPLTGRPMIICDVDEVALEFVVHLERHLISRGFELIPRSFALTGNIVAIDDRRPARAEEVRDLLVSFFAEASPHQTPVEGAAAALARLSAGADVVMLTNIPTPYRQSRIDTLARHGLNYPVVTNSGTKGPAAQALAERSDGPVFFLDDSPNNIRSVDACVSGAVLIHFIADKRFFDLAEPIDRADLTTRHWDEAGRFIAGKIGL